MTPTETVNRALAIARRRQADAPSVQMFDSIVRQLEYMARVLSGEESDRSKMKSIIVGQYALREIEDVDPEFAEVLFDVQTIASKMAKGLRVT